MLHKKSNRLFTVLGAATVILFITSAHAEETPTGDARAAADKLSMCIGCHGIKGYKSSFPQVYHVPKIAGQNAEYLAAALKEYADGSRSFPTMQAVAQSLTPQDMADLAAYYSSLR